MIGVAPWASVPALPMTGRKLPALLRSAKYFRPASPASLPDFAPVERPAARTPRIAWLEARGSPASATWPAYSGFSRSAQSVGELATRSLFTRKDITP
ncbi:hypothetical protein D3C78_1368880 [compost metagenome]